jgi:hypothetical protein
VCKDLLTDAVMIPCCGNSFCDECKRHIYGEVVSKTMCSVCVRVTELLPFA